MNSGELRHRIKIQKLEKNQDTFGQPVESWPDVATVWASVEPLVGRQFFEAETITHELTHKIKLRYRQGVTPSMRVKFGDRYFQIVSIINYQERNRELQLMCRELI
jgi:SPP1 family predicted phage head-tail adaptor